MDLTEDDARQIEDEECDTQVIEETDNDKDTLEFNPFPDENDDILLEEEDTSVVNEITDIPELDDTSTSVVNEIAEKLESDDKKDDSETGSAKSVDVNLSTDTDEGPSLTEKSPETVTPNEADQDGVNVETESKPEETMSGEQEKNKPGEDEDMDTQVIEDGDNDKDRLEFNPFPDENDDILLEEEDTSVVNEIAAIPIPELDDTSLVNEIVEIPESDDTSVVNEIAEIPESDDTRVVNEIAEKSESDDKKDGTETESAMSIDVDLTTDTDEVLPDNSPAILTSNETAKDEVLVDTESKTEENASGEEEKNKPGEEEKNKSDEDEDMDMPMIRMNSNIFEAPNEDEEDEEDDDEMDPSFIQSMMQVEMDEQGEDGTFKTTPKKQRRSVDDKLTEEEPMRRTPRRAAAQAAANTIKEITSLELQDGPPTEASDPAYRAATVRRNSSSTTSSSTATPSKSGSAGESERHRCHQCKNVSQSLIVVRQYGTDIHLCSNSCFNSFRNPDPIFRPLPCAKCGNLNRDNENAKLFFWETMNFCSDLCVGNYQLQFGSSCSTCSRKTPWTCMGKYCVRFGSDVRQFCTASCLESYKKSARVCFHCQLDIKRLGNVVLANIPSKATTKEFCSQDCVEMYIEQNVRGGANSQKPAVTGVCGACRLSKLVFKELVTATSSHRACSQVCWAQILESQKVTNASKCETCSKFINMDSISISPSFYVATEKRAHGFCSATCKNVYVLKSRQILSCTTCKVKKYNYDLIQHVTGRVTNYAVCSLNCLPRPSQYILKLKDTIHPSSGTLLPKPRKDAASSVPTITSVVGNANNRAATNGEINLNGFGSGTIVNGEGGYDYGVSGITVRKMGDDDIIEIRDDDVIALDESQTQIVPQNAEDVPLEDDRWGDCGMLVVVGKTEPIARRNKGCQVRPIKRTQEKEVQTDSEELWAMPRVEMKLPEPEEKVRYVPVPIPYPVLMPFPCYAMDRPIPVPFPIGIAVPIPIPVNLTNFLTGGLTFNDIPSIEVGPSGSVPTPTTESDDVEMMDTSETCDPDPTAASSYLNLFNFSNSPMSVGSPSAGTTASGPSSSAAAPGSPLGGKGRLSRADQGIRAWKLNFPDDRDPLSSPPEEFSEKLVTFVLRATKPKGDRCRIEPGLLFNYILGIQQYLKNGGRSDSFFYDSVYSPFVKAMIAYAEEEASRGRTIAGVDEEHVWDSMELGVGSPGILLFTLIYHIYKHFNLKTWQEHAALEFSQIHVQEKTSESGETHKFISIDGITNVDNELIEVPEISDNSLRCLIKLFEFYKSKCATTEGTFYKSIESNTTEGSSWYTAESLNQFDLYHMLVRAMMIHFESIE